MKKSLAGNPTTNLPQSCKKTDTAPSGDEKSDKRTPVFFSTPLRSGLGLHHLEEGGMSSADDYDKELSGYCNEIPVIKRKWDRLFKTEGILVRFQGYFAIALFLLIVTCISTCDIQPAYADAVDVAISQIGRGEEGSDNHGKSVRKYLRGQEGLSWCAGFVSYCLEQSGVDCGYTLRARAFLKKGRIVLNPRRGDLIVFWRGNRSGNMGHVGIVEKVTDTEIVTIEGNKGAFPSKVSRFHYAKNKIGNLIGFVRVEDSNCYHNPNKTA